MYRISLNAENGRISRNKYTLGPVYNKFGYNEHPAVTSRLLCIKIIDCNGTKISYNKHPLVTSSFLCIFLLVVSLTQ